MARVLLLFGGRSAEHEVSCVSAMAVAKALAGAGHSVTPIGIDRAGSWHLADTARARLIAEGPAAWIEVPRGVVREAGPSPELRAVQITASDSATKLGLIVYRNMRVPTKSVIHHAFSGQLDAIKATENLEWWETSDGSRLMDIDVRVEARFSYDRVLAIVTPR